MQPFIVTLALLAPVALLQGCGTNVPAIGEIWDDDTGVSSIPIERKIKEKIYCELNRAVSELNTNKDLFIEAIGPDPKTGKRKNFIIKPVPETYGATLSLTLTVEEMSSLSPSVSLNTPLLPQDTVFPGNIVIPGPQSFSVSFGGNISSGATRYDKYTFFYKIKNLATLNEACDVAQGPEGEVPSKYRGSSLLIESNLGIKKWLRKMFDMRTGIGVSEKSSDKSSAQVFTYNIKFDVISSGNVTPTWRLTPVTSPADGLPLFSAKRQRNHEMILTIGPLDEKEDRPSQLTNNDFLSAQIGSAVGSAVGRNINR